LDEPEEVGPEVSFIICSFPFSSGGEGLARARAGPDMSLIGPACSPKCVGPDADSGEEVYLIEALEICGLDVDD